MLELKFRKDPDYPDVTYAEVVLEDNARNGGKKAVIVAALKRRVARPDPTWWDVSMLPPGLMSPDEVGASFDRAEFSRLSLREAKQEIAARLFIGMIGRREGRPIRRID
jgi:hypothetical protein